MKTIELNEQQAELITFLLTEVEIKNYSKTDKKIATQILDNLNEA